MSNTISFGNVILAQSGKKGILRPIDDSGYYMLNAGGFNIPNRGGITYRANDYIYECMGPDSDLSRRVARGEVYMELDHPPQYYLEKINGQIVRTRITDVFEWILRLRTIIMDRVCAHIRKIHWDVTGDRNAPIYNRVETIPFGPFKDMFQQSLDTPDINTSISVRTVTKPQKRGDRVREVDYFTGYDYVPEGGMDHANKHMTAGLEHYLQDGALAFGEDNELTTDFDAMIYMVETTMSNPTVMQRFEGTESLKELGDMLAVLKKAGAVSRKISMVNQSSLSLFS
ncbi:hypothetical protein NFI00_000146 [Salmonella enterica]|nr:hypothetical protein [Salmonella enterica]